MKKPNVFLALALSIALIFPSLFTPFAAHAAFDSASAQNYLSTHQGSPWVTLGLVASGASSIQSDYLKSVTGSKAIDFEAPILAITALGKNPRTFGTTDYVAKLESYDSNGQIGDATTLNDDVFGLLALVSAGRSSSSGAAGDAKTFILNHQNNDGGWGFAVSAGSDSNTTAAAITALISAGVTASDTHIQNALTYLKTAQNADGGFTYDPTSSYGTDSDSSSTAWVIWALDAVGITPSSWNKTTNTPLSYLSSNQAAAGYFKFQSASSEDSFSAVTTAYAAIALAGKTLPLAKVTDSGNGNSGQDNSGGSGSNNNTPTTPAPAPQYSYRIQGVDHEICSGKINGTTALDIVKNASVVCGFTYHIQDTSYGPYLDQVAGTTAAGTQGWLYDVNFSAPDVGASSYTLKTGDSVLWYYGDFTWKPLRLTLSAEQVASGQQAVVHVESLSGSTWSALAGATVLYGASQTITDNSGNAQITPADGYYKIFAKKDSFITSNSALLQVGQPTSPSVSLSANLQLGSVAGTSTPGTIAFTVNPSSLDFGTLSAGQSATKEVTITNTGSATISMQTIVSGDDAFINGLSLDGNLWNAFSQNISAGSNHVTSVKLSLPASASGQSHQASGTVIFWAVAQ